ncbi:MAG: hypothetical protein FWC61_01805 [Proteobacteria bacterium]|nr:hypothetical protein [Pseudomonadota bacterium]
MKEFFKKINLAFVCALCFTLYALAANAASVIATVNGNPVTDTDITSRVKLMSKQGSTPTNNRIQALSNIIDDYVRLAFAENFKATPTDSDLNKEMKNLESRLGAMDAPTRAMARFSLRAQIAWQIIVGRTIIPTIKVSDDDIQAEKADLERTHGLPVDVTFVRLLDIPAAAAAKLTAPKSCDGAIGMAKSLGGDPQKITAKEYELSPDIRERIAGLPLLTWSPVSDRSVLLVCGKQKTKEYGNLDEIIKQNAIFKRAMFTADQQLKQLRRKAVVIINDPTYKGAI